MSPVKRKTWNQSEYSRQMPIVGGTLTECVLDLPEAIKFRNCKLAKGPIKCACSVKLLEMRCDASRVDRSMARMLAAPSCARQRLQLKSRRSWRAGSGNRCARSGTLESPRPAPGGSGSCSRVDAYRLACRLAPPLGPLLGPLPRTSPLETSLTQSEPLPL